VLMIVTGCHADSKLRLSAVHLSAEPTATLELGPGGYPTGSVVLQFDVPRPTSPASNSTPGGPVSARAQASAEKKRSLPIPSGSLHGNSAVSSLRRRDLRQLGVKGKLIGVKKSSIRRPSLHHHQLRGYAAGTPFRESAHATWISGVLKANAKLKFIVETRTRSLRRLRREKKQPSALRVASIRLQPSSTCWTVLSKC